MPGRLNSEERKDLLRVRFPHTTDQRNENGHKWWPHASIGPHHLTTQKQKAPRKQGFHAMEPSGLEPLTSWVRSRRSPS